MPANGQVIAGSASIHSNGNVMTVNQGSDRMIATWDTFNVGSAAQVKFQQPGSSSVALNRVTGSDGSQILGQLSANGQVYLINPSGVLFGAGSMVNVGGLVASSLDISNSDFMAGRKVFAGKSQGAVINQGTITAGDGGSVALLGAQVRNEGTVVARLGSVVLGGGEKITLDLNGDGLINLEVNDPVIGASVANSGVIRATGGLVALSARDSQAMLSNVVNNEGVIEARSLQQRNGRVILDGGSNGVVVNSGTLDVSGRNSGETGGNVSMTGEYVGLFDSGKINAEGDVGGGTVLLGGDYQGSGGVHQANATYMGSDARISADALSNGNGGKVVLWSLDSTQFHGGISVKGAGIQGRGGLVETSGHALEVTGIVDLSAVSGNGGTWLIDPFNINITQGASSGATSTSPFTSSGAASSNLSSATLNASLSEGANILVCTSSVGGTSGDINVLSNVRAVGNATLTLQAHRNIVMTNTSISNATGKTLNVSLYSNFNNTGNGSVALSNATVSTNGGNLTISGAVQPNQAWASTNVSNGSGISLSNGTRITTSGGNVILRGATSATLAAGSTATGVSISGSSIDAGGGNISISALQASISGIGDGFVLSGGSRLVTTGLGSITVDSTNLGSGNGTRIFSTSNSIAASGSGNVTLRGNATSGAGVLVCSTAAASSQSLSVGTGTLTVQGNSNGRGVYLAAAGDGAVNLSSAQGGAIVLDGSSTASYGTILNSTGATSSINLATDGAISLTGATAGGNIAALALATSGNSTATAPGASIKISSRRGDINFNGNSTAPLAGSGILFNATGTSQGVNVSGGSGNITLRGNAVGASDAVVLGGGAGNDISTQGGSLTISGTVQPSQSSTSSNLSNGSGVSLSSGTFIATHGGDINLNGATASTLATGSTATGVSVRGSRLDAGGGNISISALQASVGGAGDGFTLASGSSLITTGLGSITVDSTNLGSGNGTRIFSTSNSIAASGSGNVTLRGNAASGAGVLVCSTAAASSQSLSVGTGTLTVQGNSNGRGVYLAAAGDGTVNLSSGQGGAIVLDGSSTASYGTILNSTGATSSINLITDGAISLTGTETGGSIAALALVTSGSGTATTPGASINIASSGGDVRLKANQNTVSISNGSFRGLSLDAGGDYSTIRIATQSGDLSLDGSSVSGRGVEIAPSGANAAISLATGSGDIDINGTSATPLAGYGVFLNSTGSSQGVNVSSGAGNITLRGSSVGASDAVVIGGSSGNRISTQGGNFSVTGVVQPSQSSTSSNLSNGSGVSLGSGTFVATHGGDINLNGATAAGSSASGVSVRGSRLDAGGGNININALQTSVSGSGDGFTLTGGSSLITTGLGSITVDSTSLGSGNGTRIFSTSNSIAATGSGNVTLRGNATSGAGVLVCSTAAVSSQSLSVGTGTLTVQGNSNGRGVYLAAAGDGAVSLSSGQGGAIVLDGSSTGSFGTILNSTGATSSINLTTDGAISLTGTTAGGTTPALALVTPGAGTAATPGASINISSSRGDVLLKANHNTLSTASGSFKALSLDAGGDYSTIRIATQSGDLTLDGTSVSGRGVDIAPSGANASISLATTSGDITISGNSTMPFGGYGIFFNATGNSQGVNVSSGSGNITLRGDSVGTSDAIALGGSTGNGVSSNRITSDGGDITLIGNFHSPNSGELDHGIAILSVNNILQTRGDGNLTLIGSARDQGSGVEVYGNGKAQLSVENGALSITGSSGAGDGIGLLTGQNLIQATGTGSVTLNGQSQGGSGINIYPSGTGSSLTLSTVSGDLSLTGISAATSSKAGLSIRSGGSGTANGVQILSRSGDIHLTGTTQGSGDGIAFSAVNASGYNRVATGGDGNLTLTGRSAGGAALSFDDGNNSLQVADGLLLVDVDSPSGRYITHTDDATSLTASGAGVVVISRGGLINSSLLDPASAPTTQYLQLQMARSAWSQPLAPDYHLTALGSVADQVSIDVAQWRSVAAADTAGARSSSKTDRE
nr:filamentous hemagglutinin N-terminal domain-containing protein [Pseudomonas sp. dw_612]